MDPRTDIVATAVRILAENTSLIRKPSETESFFTLMMGAEPFEYRKAREITETIDEVVNLVKRANNYRKFKKIVKNNF